MGKISLGTIRTFNFFVCFFHHSSEEKFRKMADMTIEWTKMSWVKTQFNPCFFKETFPKMF